MSSSTLASVSTGSQRAPIEYAFDPIREYFNRDDISEICINEPGAIWIEVLGSDGMERIDVPQFTMERLMRISERIAESCGQSINPESPLLSATLHNGDRVQIVRPPNCGMGQYVISIRKQVIKDVSLEYLDRRDYFAEAKSSRKGETETNELLKELLDQQRFVDFITKAVLAKKNIIISGGTSTGKTTLLNAIAKIIPFIERIITIEDVNDVKLPQPNVASLLYSKSSSDASAVSVDMLLEASMRLRPDRILLSEITGVEAFTYLNSIETGHPGSITTIHANSPSGVYRRLSNLLQLGNNGFTADSAMTYIKSIVDVVIQIKREGGRRFVSDIHYADIQ